MTAFLFLAFAVIPLAVLGVAWLRFERPHGETMSVVPAIPEPEPRVPRDTDRPYPRPKGGRRKADRMCPVCGTGDGTGTLDGKVLGWRAHGSCAEWLGDWQPESRSQVDAGLQKALDAFGSVGRAAGTYIAQPAVVPRGTSYSNTISTGGTVATIGRGGGGGGYSSSPDSMALTNHVAATIRQQLTDGQVTVDEARERIISAFEVPGPALGAAVGDADSVALGHLVALQEMFLNSEARACRDAIEQRRKPPGKPVITEYCTCGTKFTGTPEWIRMRLDVHHASGACPHSVKGRAADLRDLEGR